MCVLSRSSVTVKVASSPSSTVSSEMDRVGSDVSVSSLSVIVPYPMLLFRVAPLGPLRVTVKVSLDSSTLSSTVGTVMVFSVSFGAKVSELDPAA